LILGLPVVGLFALFFLLALPPLPGWERGPFPQSLALGETVVAQTDGGFREGCGYALIRLADESAREVEAGGEAYLLAMRSGRNGVQLSPWRETPVATGINESDPTLSEPITFDGELLFARHTLGCQNAPEVSAALSGDWESQPGSYYATFNRGEGVLYILPKRRLALYLYFG